MAPRVGGIGTDAELVEKIVKKAGLVPWPRLFHNLWASRETKLSERFPIKVVTAWIGNTPEIAMEHYLEVTDQHWQRALEGDGKGQEPDQDSGTVHRRCETPVQSIAVWACKEPDENQENPGNTAFSGDASGHGMDGEGYLKFCQKLFFQQLYFPTNHWTFAKSRASQRLYIQNTFIGLSTDIPSDFIVKWLVDTIRGKESPLSARQF